MIAFYINFLHNNFVLTGLIWLTGCALFKAVLKTWRFHNDCLMRNACCCFIFRLGLIMAFVISVAKRAGFPDEFMARNQNTVMLPTATNIKTSPCKAFTYFQTAILKYLPKLSPSI